MDELWKMSATDLASGIRTKLFRPSEVLDAHLDRVDAVNGQLNAIVRLIDEARDQARQADCLVTSTSSLPPLFGVPFTVKENLDVAGYPTTDGVPQGLEAIATHDDPAVERLRAAGAIPFARTNLPDFGLRLHTHSSLYGRTNNPFRRDVTPGGSSGGEGSAIASGMSPLGLGNDIGGSVRNPAYCCGISSLKPTPNTIAHASSTSATPPSLSSQLMATTGPMARTVGDVALAYRLVVGTHVRDPFCAPVAPPTEIHRPCKVALVPEPPGGPTNEAIARSVRWAGDALRDLGYDVFEVEPPDIVRVRTIWSRLLMADIAHSLEDLKAIGSPDAVWILEEAILEYGAPDLAEVVELHQQRHALAVAWSEFFETFPILVGPVWTEPPFAHDFDIESRASQSVVNMLSRFVAPMNVLGLPAVSVPVGLNEGLPLGVQVVANRYFDERALHAALDLESQVEPLTPIDPR
jgi:amidase